MRWENSQNTAEHKRHPSALRHLSIRSTPKQPVEEPEEEEEYDSKDDRFVLDQLYLERNKGRRRDHNSGDCKSASHVSHHLRNDSVMNIPVGIG